MRASNGIAAGRFFGGDLEPGTFHQAQQPIGEFVCGDLPDTSDADTSGDFTSAGTTPSRIASNTTEFEAGQNSPIMFD